MGESRNGDAQETLIWRALADPTRRRIMDLLRAKPRTTGQLAAEFDISRIAVMRHLAMLAKSGLVVNRKRGRERWHYINAVPLQRVYRRWVGRFESASAEGLLRLGSVVEEMRLVDAREFQLSLNIAQEILLAAPPTSVFDAITRQVAAWWGHPYTTERAIGLSLDGRLGGAFVETWEGHGGKVLATVTAIDDGRQLELTGPFHLGLVLSVAEFRLDGEGNGTRLRFSHRAFGPLEPETAEEFAGGWTELLTVRLKAFVESGTSMGIAGDHAGA